MELLPWLQQQSPQCPADAQLASLRLVWFAILKNITEYRIRCQINYKKSNCLCTGYLCNRRIVVKSERKVERWQLNFGKKRNLNYKLNLCHCWEQPPICLAGMHPQRCLARALKTKTVRAFWEDWVAFRSKLKLSIRGVECGCDYLLIYFTARNWSLPTIALSYQRLNH